MGWTVIKDGQRSCIICGENKLLSEFYCYAYRTAQGNAGKRYSSRCKSCERQRRKDRYAVKGEQDREAARRWKRNNREHVRDYSAKYRASQHGKRIKAANQRRRKHLLRAAEGTYSESDIGALLEAQKGKCAYCRDSIRQGYTIDHIQPVSKGGTNWPSNLQLVCSSCNSRKHNKDPIDWANSIGLLV